MLSCYEQDWSLDFQLPAGYQAAAGQVRRDFFLQTTISRVELIVSLCQAFGAVE